MRGTILETELKLDMAAEDADALARHPLLLAAGEPDRLELRARYHDTADERLRAAGLSLRVRVEGGRHLQTVKASGAAAGLFARPEWEMEVPDEAPVIDAAAGPLVAALGGEAVAVRFETDVRRARWLLRHEGAVVEVALDRGEVRAGGVAVPLSELELELKDGPVAALFALARALDAVAPLRLGMRSKAERGFLLADGPAPRGFKAEPVALDPEGDVSAAFVAIAHACLRQFRLNEALLLAGSDDPLPLHQARVGLRRLRTAFALFKPLFRDDPRAGVLAAELRALAATLGAVRDLDVLIAAREEPLREQLAQARADAFAIACARLNEPATRRLMLDLAEWLALGDWRAGAGEEPGAIVPFAAALLRKRRKRLKRNGAHLATLGEHDRHQVRIEAKKMRYAAEFFAALWTGNKAERRRRDFLDAIEALQDELGHLNDAATARDLLGRLGLAADAPAEAAPGRHALKRAEQALDALIDVKPFWR